MYFNIIFIYLTFESKYQPFSMKTKIYPKRVHCFKVPKKHIVHILKINIKL